MSQTDTAHAWWSRLRHQGLLLSPVVMVERYPSAPPAAAFYVIGKLRDAQTRFVSTADNNRDGVERDQAVILNFVDTLLENFLGHTEARLAKQHTIPEKLTAVLRSGSRSETVRPHRVIFADEAGTIPAVLVMADTSPQVGRGRGRTKYAQLLELLRGTGHRLGLLTNGQQFRLVYAGLDFESWCEWESDRWFDDGEGTEELCGLRQLLSPESLKPIKEGVCGLLDAVEESRKRQADLSSVLRENVRQAVELLLEEASTANRTKTDLFARLVAHEGDRSLTDVEAHEALFQATVRIVMRVVVCLFAESRQLLPVNDPTYAQSYGVRTLYESLENAVREESIQLLLSAPYGRGNAWSRLMALFRLIYTGSAHGAFPLRAYGGVLFRPGDDNSPDPVARALHILEHGISVGDATIYYILRKLLRGLLPVIKGRSKTFVEGPVDYTELRTEFIGLIYEGLLDYRLKRTDEKIGPQIFLNLGREPVLPLSRLTDMLTHDKKGLKDLLITLRKEKVMATVAEEEEEAEEETDETTEDEEVQAEEPPVEIKVGGDEMLRTGDYLDAVESAKAWAKDAVVLAGLVRKQGKRESDSQYQQEIETVADRLINKVVAVGEFYLVRAGNTRKGTGTFYTRPQLAVPTVHRTLEPLCYDKADDGNLIPKKPEDILGLKVCDSACGSASFLVAALHYMTDALFRSLCHHRKLDDPAQSKKLTLPYGQPRTNKEGDELVPFPPNDPQRGDTFADRIKALLRRHVVERCIYGVDINPLAVELARVSLWVETLDPELPFSFLDHKIKVGNSLVGCWLDRVEDYPLKAWEREGGDGKDGPRTQRIEEFLKGVKVGNRRTGDGRIKKEMREVIESRFSQQAHLFPDEKTTTENVVALARAEYEKLHDLPISDPDERERYYREHIEESQPLRTLKAAMDEWCAVWYWPTDEDSLRLAPTPLTFHKGSAAKDALVERLADSVKFFHWEMEFPDAFTPDRSGFDGMIGNPPWDVMKPNSQEFFTEFDPLYRTYDKQVALRKQKELAQAVPGVADQWGEYNGRFKALGNWARNVAEPFDLSLARGKEGDSLGKLWANHRSKHVCYADTTHPFHLQGSADLNSYKMFAEFFWYLLRPDGRLGVILPTGIYSDYGTRDLRTDLLNRGRLDLLYAFQNERRVFSAAHHAFKQVALTATKGGCTQSFRTRFRMGVGDSPEAHEIPDDILRLDSQAMVITPEEVKVYSPKSFSVVEIKCQRDLEIYRHMYTVEGRLGANVPDWVVEYTCEFHMTNDSKHFPRRDSWESRGYSADVFGAWIDREGHSALPLLQGVSINQFDPAFKQMPIAGNLSLPVECRTDEKFYRPKFLIDEECLAKWTKFSPLPKIGQRRIANPMNARSLTTCVVRGFGCGDTLACLTVNSGDLAKSLIVSSLMNSLLMDFVTRSKVVGVHIDWHHLESLPMPFERLSNDIGTSKRLIFTASSLTFIHRRFAPDWLRLKALYPEFVKREWKHWWAVTEADRLRLRVEIDALCADLFGLDPDDFDWIVRDDPKDSKGFYRVDRNLPFQERLTGLAAAAFRALKEGKWSAESAAKLSNDEFFALISIPEMTTGPEPLIRKRDGCHRWKPEEFGKDDPRFGWTWDHCWQDAVALLGSEDAVREYIEPKKEKPAEEDGQQNGPTDLLGNPTPGASQGRLF